MLFLANIAFIIPAAFGMEPQKDRQAEEHPTPHQSLNELLIAERDRQLKMLKDYFYTVASSSDQLRQELREISTQLRCSGETINTPLTFACANGKLESARILIDLGANINAKNSKGYTALDCAYEKNHTILINLLEEKIKEQEAKKKQTAQVQITTSSQKNEDISEPTTSNAPEHSQTVPADHDSNHQIPQDNTQQLNDDMFWAIRNQQNNLEDLKRALSAGANPDAINSSGYTALGNAVAIGNLDFVKCLVDHRATLDLADSSNKTPITLAAEWGELEIMKYLISKNLSINVNHKDTRGLTPLMHAVTGYNFRTDNLKIIKYLIEECNADLKIADNDGNTVVEHSALCGQINALKYLIEEKKMHLNLEVFAKNFSYKTGVKVLDYFVTERLITTQHNPAIAKQIFFKAVKLNQLDMIKRLLADDCGVSVNTQDENGWTALMHAVDHGNMRTITKYLIEECHADICKTNKAGESAIDLALAHGNSTLVTELRDALAKKTTAQLVANDQPRTPTHALKKILDLPIPSFTQELQKDPQLINRRSRDGKTPLILAIEQQKTNHINSLLSFFKANPWITDNNGESAFHTAIKKNDLKTLQLLLKTNGFERCLDPIIRFAQDNNYDRCAFLINNFNNTTDKSSWLFWHDNHYNDPWLQALLLGDYEKIKQVIANDPSKVNAILPIQSLTPLALAAYLADKELMKLLIEKKATVDSDYSTFHSRFSKALPSLFTLDDTTFLLDKHKLYPNKINASRCFDLIKKNEISKLNQFLKGYELINTPYSDIPHDDIPTEIRPHLQFHVPKLDLTPLHYAVSLDNVDAVHTLIKHGAKINNSGIPLLSIACLKNSIKMMRFLSENFNKKELINCNGSEEFWPFNYKISQEVKDELFRLFDDYYDNYCKNHEFTTGNKQLELTQAAWLERQALIDRALKTGAVINNISDRKLSALHEACVRGLPHTIAMLIKEGANVNQVTQEKQRSCLRLLFRMHKNSPKKIGQQLTTSELLPCLFLLICAGANQTIPDIKGKTVLYWLHRQGFNNATKKLVLRTLNAKALPKDKRAVLLEDIYKFQESEHNKLLDNPDKQKQIKNASVRTIQWVFATHFKDIYKEYIEQL